MLIFNTIEIEENNFLNGKVINFFLILIGLIEK